MNKLIVKYKEKTEQVELIIKHKGHVIIYRYIMGENEVVKICQVMERHINDPEVPMTHRIVCAGMEALKKLTEAVNYSLKNGTPLEQQDNYKSWE